MRALLGLLLTAGLVALLGGCGDDAAGGDGGGDTIGDGDGDGYLAASAGGDDCDDTRADVNPAGVEVCGDGVDQDCSGADQDCSSDDADGDGFSPLDGDCDDTDPAVNPGAEETPYNGRDDDCDTTTPDDDLDMDGFSTSIGGDCDDMDPGVFPGADEVPYDGIDQDCSGGDLVDVDRDGFDAMDVGGDDCDDMRPDLNPDAEEIPYDGSDQNCDGSDLIGTTIPISTADGSQSMPSVAFGGGAYLVVWADARSGIDEIYGQRVDSAGALVGGEILIHTTTMPVTAFVPRTPAPDVAFNGTDFLVVWRDLFMGGRGEIYAKRVGTDGSLIGSAIQVGDGDTASDTAPRVASDGTNWLVAYRETNDVSIRLIETDGTVGSTTGIRVGTSIRTPPSVASDGMGYVVTWGEAVTGGTVLYSRFVSAAGMPSSSTDIVSTSTIAQGGLHWDGSTYLSTFSVGGDVYGQQLDGSGSLIGTTADANFLISDAPGNQTNPESARVGSGLSVVFVDSRWPQPTIYTQRVGTDRVPFATPTDENAILYAGPTGSGDPRIASAGASALVVFRSGSDIHAVRLEP
jgi:hypothetical protein